MLKITKFLFKAIKKTTVTTMTTKTSIPQNNNVILIMVDAIMNVNLCEV